MPGKLQQGALVACGMEHAKDLQGVVGQTVIHDVVTRTLLPHLSISFGVHPLAK